MTDSVHSGAESADQPVFLGADDTGSTSRNVAFDFSRLPHRRTMFNGGRELRKSCQPTLADDFDAVEFLETYGNTEAQTELVRYYRTNSD